MSAKRKSGQAKKALNVIIKAALRKRNMPYTNMDKATADMAAVLEIDISSLDRVSARRAVASAVTGKVMPDILAIIKNGKKEAKQKKTVSRLAFRAQRGNYLLGKPSASTLERDIENFYNSWEWKRLSFDIKQARGRTCECCGAKAPQVKIITDHIKPLRHFWDLRLDPSNMQILCDDCNMGKGSRNQTDFRALNAAEAAAYPIEPELTEEETERLAAIKNQLRLN